MNQSCREYEIIIQDGISTDNTLGVVSRLAEQHPSVSWNVTSEKDSGVYDAMNRAIIRSSGKWLLFLGSDDLLYDPNVLKSATVQLKQTSANMVYGNAKLMGDSVWAKNSDTDIYDGPFTLSKLFEKNICHQAVFYNRSLFDELGLFDSRFKICADWDFNFRCFAKTNVEYFDRIISFFSAGGISNTGSDQFKEESIFILKDYFKINFWNNLFKTYSWVFLHHSIAAWKREKISHSLYYLLLSYFHATNKMLLVKIVVRKLFRI